MEDYDSRQSAMWRLQENRFKGQPYSWVDLMIVLGNPNASLKIPSDPEKYREVVRNFLEEEKSWRPDFENYLEKTRGERIENRKQSN